MLRVGLTGGIATGKSHVRAHFAALGAPTIDADVLARQAVAPGSPGLRAVVDRFGDGVLDSTAALDRRKLGSIVFSDAKARRDLEAIVHPFVRAETERWFAELAMRGAVAGIADIPLLYEVGREGEYDVVVVAACEPATQLARVMARDRVSEAEARQRIESQLPITEKVRRADYVISTEGALDQTNRQVEEVYRQLLARAG